MAGQENTDTLVARIAMADRAAFERLYEIHAAPLFGIAVGILETHPEAESVLENLFVTLWDNADDWRGHASPADVEIVQSLRRAAVAIKRNRSNDPGRIATKDLFVTPQAIAHDHNDTALGRAMSDLSAAQATLVARALYGGESYGDIALASDVDKATVRASLQTSFRKLSKALDPGATWSEADIVAAAERSLGLADPVGRDIPIQLQARWDQDVVDAVRAKVPPLMPPKQVFRRTTAQAYGAPQESLWQQLWPFAVGGIVAALVLWIAVSTNVLLPLE